jgi:parvulin-like peptidyl-prolyl isomerase
MNSLFKLSLTILLLTLIGCSETKTQQTSEQAVVASVGDRNILSSDLLERLVVRSDGLNQRVVSQTQKQSVLDELIEREVQIAAALEAGFLNDPAITAALENLMINKLRSEQLDKLLSEVIIPQIEIDQYYQQNIQKYTTPAMTRLAIIRLSLSSQASADKRSAVKGQAEQVYKLAFTLPDSINGFGSLAAKYSDHQASRYAGGDMGWIKNDAENGQVDNAILKALAQLELNGDLAPVIEGTAGFYLVKLLDRRTETVKRLQKVGSNIQRLLEREKRQQVEADWLLALQNNGQPLVINQDALAAITVPINAESSSKQIVPPLLPGK